MKAKQKSIEEILAESDAEDEAEIDERFRNRNKTTKNSSAWIQEDADNIVDFTDVSAAKKIRATNPAPSTSQEAKKTAKSEIKTAADGRLIIVDDSDDDEEMRRTTRRRNFSDSESETEDKKEPEVGRKRKRRNSVTTDGQSVTSTKYKGK